MPLDGVIATRTREESAACCSYISRWCSDWKLVTGYLR